MKGLHKIRQKWNDSKLGRNDISVRIYLSFVVVLAVSLLLTGAIFNYLYQRNYTRSYTELLTKQGKKIARRVSKFQYKKNVGQYEKYSVYIDEIESAENTDVWILSNHKAKNALKDDFTNAEMNDDNLTDEMYAVLRQAFGGQTGASSSYDDPSCGDPGARLQIRSGDRSGYDGFYDRPPDDGTKRGEISDFSQCSGSGSYFVFDRFDLYKISVSADQQDR